MFDTAVTDCHFCIRRASLIFVSWFKFRSGRTCRGWNDREASLMLESILHKMNYTRSPKRLWVSPFSRATSLQTKWKKNMRFQSKILTTTTIHHIFIPTGEHLSRKWIYLYEKNIAFGITDNTVLGNMLFWDPKFHNSDMEVGCKN